jgi:hypothetical protein
MTDQNDKSTKANEARALVASDPQRYRLLKSGAIMDTETGKLVGHTGEGPFQITSETSRQMLAKRREKTLISWMRGLASKDGKALAPEATDEEILMGALDGVEALVAHTKAVYLKSNNIRGLGEALGKLTNPLLDRPLEEDQPATYAEFRGLLAEMAAAARAIEAKQDAIPGEITEE